MSIQAVEDQMRAWSALRNNVRMDALWESQHGQCWYCGCDVAHSSHWVPRDNSFMLMGPQKPCSIDHQTPKCQGGSNRSHNLVLACVGCNSQKSGKNIDQYRAWLGIEAFHGERP